MFHLQHGLLVFAVLYLCRGQVKNGPFHCVSLCVVDVDIRPAYHHISLNPAITVGLQELQITFL